MIIEQLILSLIYFAFNYLDFILIFLVAAILMHCFCDDAIVVSKKRTLLFGAGNLVLSIGIAVSQLFTGYIYGYIVGFISRKLQQEIDYVATMESFYYIQSIPLYLWTAFMIAFRKGSGVKKTVLRMIGSFCFFWLFSTACAIPGALIRYGVTEIGLFSKHLTEVTIFDLTVNEISRCAFQLVLLLILYFGFYRKGVALRLRKVDAAALVVYYIILRVLVELFSLAEKENIPLGSGNPAVRIILISAMLLLIVMIPVLLVRTRLGASYKEMNTYQQNFLEAELNASRQYKAAQEDTRAFRHDVQNNLTAIAMLMQEGKIDEAERYLNDMRTEVNALSPKVVSGDDMVDSLISSKLAKMSENGIRFSMDGVIDGGLNWKPMDICTVFANLLDNAIEAASQTEDGFIRLECKKTGHHRLIRASNSCKENVDCESLLSGESHITSKADKSLHGYGIGNIRKTVEKYGGMMQISCAERVFTMELLLAK